MNEPITIHKGQIVLWYHAKDVEAVPAIVIRARGNGVCDLHIFAESTVGGVPQDSVRHYHDPDVERSIMSGGGCWDYTEFDSPEARRIQERAKHMKQPA